MEKYIIAQNMSGTGNIHDISSTYFDREIIFRNGYQYAVVLASRYGGKGYTTHKTEESAVASSNKNSEYSHKIIDALGNVYYNNGYSLEINGSLNEDQDEYFDEVE